MELNYQFLSTLSIQPEEFRPADLPEGWDHSPADDPRHDVPVSEAAAKAFGGGWCNFYQH